MESALPTFLKSFSRRLLQEEEELEEDNLGTFIPEYEIINYGDTTIIKKSYDDEDFVEMYYDLGGETPNIDFE